MPSMLRVPLGAPSAPGIRVSLLRQQHSFGPDETLMQVARSGLASLLDLQREMEEAAQEMAEDEDDRKPIVPMACLAMVVIVGSMAMVTTGDREPEPLDDEREPLTIVLGEQV